MEQLDEILSEFLIDCHENLEQLDQDLLALESQPDDRDRLANVFRTVHTIKGNSGFLALPKLEKVTHVGESLLVPLRDGERRLDDAIATGLLGMVDAVRDILSELESSGTEGDKDYDSIVGRLEQLMSESPAKTTPAAEEVQADQAAQTQPPAKKKATPRKKSTAKKTTAKKTRRKTDKPAVSSPPAKKVLPAEEPIVDTDKQEPASEQEISITESTVRLDVALLDKLMNQVGELVLARNQILQYSQNVTDNSMLEACQSLNLITRELQTGILKTRMRSIQNIWSRIPRQVRDLCQSLGKDVHVCMEGAHTEMDKTVLEAIRGPLTHIVRNAVDHGVETPEIRLAQGKPAQGQLKLRAFHKGGFVVLEVIDDGKGLDLEGIREKAVRNGLVAQEVAQSLSVRELHQLILTPGFSTATSVTNISGRGVGMDVVKTSVEAIGGTLEIHSESGLGTTLRIRIPLTLAIVPALIVRSGAEEYAIPQIALVELLRLRKSDLEYIHNAAVFRRRGRLLPFLSLSEQLGTAAVDLHEADAINVAVLQADGHCFGLAVEDICDTQEIVVKPLSSHLKDIPMYAGATIMGDGRVSLILDVNGLANDGGITKVESAAELQTIQELDSYGKKKKTSALVVGGVDGQQRAISLASVSRLEVVRQSAIESSNGRAVMQYRGVVTPIVHIEGHPVGMSAMDDAFISIIVCEYHGRNACVVVDEIIDVVDSCLTEESIVHDAVMVIGGRTTTVTDLTHVLDHSLLHFSDFYPEAASDE